MGTDIHLPEMDGFTLAHIIRNTPELSSVPIMMLTSAGQRGDAERYRSLGVLAHLYKPVRKGELLTAIRSVLGQQPLPASAEMAPDQQRPNRKLQVLLAEDN